MSTIRATNVGPAAGGTARNLVRGVAAAWANVNNYNPTFVVRDSQNLSSAVDAGVGIIGHNLTAAMSGSRSYVVQYMVQLLEDAGGPTTFHGTISRFTNSLTSSFIRVAYGDNGSYGDGEVNMTTIYGDLA